MESNVVKLTLVEAQQITGGESYDRYVKIGWGYCRITAVHSKGNSGVTFQLSDGTKYRIKNTEPVYCNLG